MLVRAGLTAQVAIYRIHHIYGENTTVANIILSSCGGVVGALRQPSEALLDLPVLRLVHFVGVLLALLRSRRALLALLRLYRALLALLCLRRAGVPSCAPSSSLFT